ncbi:MAG: acetylxylan esterase [Lentisphaeria bacterium]|nr:acetylxylan esterase [Lentisphaeria bacterium]
MTNSLFGNNVNEYYVALARKNFEERKKKLDAITTKEQAACYVKEVKSKIEKIFAFPERTPLDAVVTNKNTFDGYCVENILYYSRPSYPVTANLYLPEDLSGKVPGVLFLCGHANEGKASDTYRSACVGLVKKGFAVLAVDPVEQGERQQYRDTPTPFGLCGNHNLMGKNLALCGEWFGAWRTWDGIRGLDYLETRSEIDSSRLCVTGNSGGGTLTTWVGAADPRPIAIAPSCYITSWKHNIENELPADIEQMPPRALEYGLEMGDFLLAQAPRHILIMGQKKDFFDPRGVVETCGEVKKINSLLSSCDTRYFIGPDEHGFSKANREAMYAFMTEVVTGKENAPEDVFTLPPPESTYAIKDGDLRNLANNKYIWAITKDMAEKFAEKRKPRSREELKTVLLSLLKIQLPEKAPYYRKLRWRCIAKDLFRNRFGLETEKDSIMCILASYTPNIVYNPDDTKKNITLVIPSLDSKEEMGERSALDGELLYTLDTRGIGEMMPSGTDQPWNRDFFSAYQFDYHYAALGMMWGKPELGKRVFDLLSAVELIAENAPADMVLTVEAHGYGCVTALMASLLSDKIHKLKLTDEMTSSYEALLTDPLSKFPLSFMVPGILQEMDLPDIKKAVAEKLV